MLKFTTRTPKLFVVLLAFAGPGLGSALALESVALPDVVTQAMRAQKVPVYDVSI